MTYRMTVCPEPGCEKQHGVVYVPKFRGSRSAQGSDPSGGGDLPALTEVSDLQLAAVHGQPAPVDPPGGSATRPADLPVSTASLVGTGNHTRGPRAPYTGPLVSPLRVGR